MDRGTTIDRMIEIEKALMHLSNDAQGNGDLFDAILAAQVALHEAAYNQESGGRVMNRIDKVIEQISKDLEFGDTTALEELLRDVPDESLKSYLPEEEGEE